MWMTLWMVAAALGCTPEELNAAAETSAAAIEAGDAEAALAAAETRLQCAEVLETGRGEAAYDLAILQEQLGLDATTSFAAATRYLPAGPDRSSAWLRVGLYASLEGNPKGVEWLEQAVEEAGPHWQVIESTVWLARVLAKTGDAERALTLLDELEAETPDESVQIRKAQSVAWSEVMRNRQAAGDVPGALEAAETSLSVLGDAPESGPDPMAEDRVMSELALGQRLLEAGRPVPSLPYLERAQETFASMQAGSMGDAFASSALAEAYRQLDRANEALALANRAVEVSAAAVGPDHPDTAAFAIRQGSVLSSLGRNTEADAAYARAEAGLTAAYGPDHPDVLFVQHDRLQLAQERGEIGTTLARTEQLLARWMRVRGAEHLDTIETAKLRCELLGTMGRVREAASCSTAAREALAGLLGEHPKVVTALATEGQAWLNAGRPKRGRARLQEALDLRIALSAVAPDPEWRTMIALQLARAELRMGRWEAAMDLLGPRPPDSPALRYLWHTVQAERLVEVEPDAAIPHLKRALEVAPTPRQRGVVQSTWGFALLRQGDPLAARAMLETALASVLEEGSDPTNEATVRLHLMQSYRATQDLSRAGEQLSEIARTFREAGIDTHPAWVQAQTELARWTYVLEPEAARALLSTAQESATRLGEDSVELAAVHQAYVALHVDQVNAGVELPADAPLSTEAALAHGEAALDILTARYGPVHPQTVAARNGLAVVALGRPDADVDAVARALRRLDTELVQAWGDDHLERIAVLTTLAHAERMRGDSEAGLAAAKTALTLQEARLDLLLSGSERQRMAAASAGRMQLGIYLALETDTGAAYSRALAWKGLAGRAFLTRPPDSPELAAVRRSLAELVFSPPADQSPEAIRDELVALTNRKEALEASVRATTTSVRWKAQCRQLEDDEAVVDWYPAFAGGDQVLKAFVLRGGDCDQVQGVDLDPEAVHGAHAKYRRVMGSRGAARMADRVSAMVREALWDPVEAVLDGRTRVTLIPDASLADISFAGLATADGGYLVERYELTTLQHLADLGVHSKPVSLDTALVVGGVAYSRSEAIRDAPKVASRSQRAGCGWKSFGALPGALTEAEAVGALLSDQGSVSVLTGSDATEDAVRSGLSGASVVHLATHGFHASRECRLDAFFEPMSSGMSTLGVVGMNPMLASGLALAGANDEPGPAGDGLLTAEEVAGVSVDADLVVLSACESGLGEVAPGEGVQGLQRGFRAAGADRVVFSLWQVPDEPTQRLMEAFYAGLAAGLRPGAALREAQVAMLERNREQRGSGAATDWAAFVVGG